MHLLNVANMKFLSFKKDSIKIEMSRLQEQLSNEWCHVLLALCATFLLFGALLLENCSCIN